MELYEKIKDPITFRIEKLEHKMEDVAVPFMCDRMMNQNQLSIEDLYYYQNQLELEDSYYDQHFIEAPKQKTITVDIFKGIDKNVLSKYNIPINYNSKDKIENVLENTIEPQLKNITKRKTTLTKEMKQMEKEIKNKRNTEDVKNK